jgi:hypothetical protein
MGWMKNTIDLRAGFGNDRIMLRDQMLDCMDETPEPTAEELAEQQAGELESNPDYLREKARFDAFKRMGYQPDADDECKMRRERGPKDEWISGHELFLNARRAK